MTLSEPTRKFAVDFRMLSILLLLAVVPLLVVTWWLFTNYQNAYLERSGANLAAAADMTFGHINSYLQHQIIETAAVTEVPVLREVIKKGNADLAGNLDQVRKAIPALAARWRSLDARSPEVAAILHNPASDFLRRYASVHRSYRTVMVTDFLGRTVAANEKTTDYYQADKDWWKETYGDGRRGTVYIGDAGYDDSAGVYSMELAQPFVDPGGGVIGALKVVVDVQDIHALIGSVRAADGATAALIRAKGTVVSAPGYSGRDTRTFPGTLELLTAREKGRRYFVGSETPPRVYGLAERSLQELYPHLNWIMTLSAPVQEIQAPLVELRRHLVVLVLVIVLLTVAASLLLSRVESAPVVPEDPHLERL